ncbi:helix-turn-helix domain-containing protein [Sulfurovum sp.]|uniref:helix-turn-helix domain-containing protein n=1 Tax=Sulfurovum sp. TaxID=1969726 RepID=UPI002867E4DC|nr:helix-turn-helix domain-containing protein [Sulfurovum sp.]
MEAQKEAKETLLAVGQKEWLNPREVNSQYGLSVSTLAKWRMYNLNLVFSKIGKYIKYKRSDIEAFLESNKVEVAS